MCQTHPNLFAPSVLHLQSFSTLYIVNESLSSAGATSDTPLANDTVHGLNYTKSYPCPPGHYCLSGAELPTPCPNGTYTAEKYGSGLFSCIPCSANHYNHLTGQTACFHCGGQAQQPYRGQTRCQCNGLHRVFMVR